MGKLIHNERIKLYKKASTWVILAVVVGLSVLTTLLLTVVSHITLYDTGDAAYTWQDRYEEQIWSEEQMEQSGSTSEAEWYRYLLEREIPPTDWKVDASRLLFDMRRELTANPEVDSALAGRLLRLQALLDGDDWRGFVQYQLDEDILLSADVQSDAERAVYREMLQMMLDMDIRPVSQSLNWLGGEEESADTWRVSQLDLIRENRLSLLRETNQNGQLLNARQRADLQRQNEVALERLRTDTKPLGMTSFPAALDNAMSSMEMLMIAVMVIAGGLIAGEFSSGTIKLLLITPHKRRSIFWAKAWMALEVLLIGGTAILVACALVSGIATLFADAGAMQVVSLFGQVVRLPYLLYLLIKFPLMLLPSVAYGALALMLSAITRKNAAAIALSIVALYGGSFLTSILAVVSQALGFTLPGAKFLLFAHTDLSIYFPMPSMMGMNMGAVTEMSRIDSTSTLGQAVMILLIYTVCFLFVARDSFCRRDVK